MEKILENNINYNLKNRFLYFSLTAFISSIIFFTAYNWKNMSRVERLGIPISLVLIGVLGWFVFKKEIYKNLSLLFSSIMIGVLFATFGQIYQTGADAYTLFLNWGIFTFLLGVASGFYPIWFLNVAVFKIAFSLYMGLYFETGKNFAYTSFFILMIIFIYLAVIKIKKLDINKIFFYFLSVDFIFLLTLLVMSESAIFGEKNSVNDLYYLISLGGFTYISEKKLKRTGVLPLSIISMVFFIQMKLLDFTLSLGEIAYYLISFIVILGAITLLLKLPNRSDKLNKILSIIVNILKFNLVSIVILLVEAVIFFIGFKEHTLGVTAFTLLMLSQYFPKFFKFKNDKTEIVTFICGAILLGIYVDDTIYNFDDFIIVLGVVAVFDIFYKFRYSRAMEYLLIPIHSVLVGTFFIDYKIFDIDKTFVGGAILLIALLGVFEYIFREREKRAIIRGLEIFIILGAIFNGIGLLVGIWQFKSLYTYVGIMASIVSIFILIINRDKLDKISFRVIILTILGVGYFCINFPNISIMLMFIILYAFRKEKYYEIISCVLLIFEISQYYYLTHTTLIEKSIALAKIGALLIGCYIILNWSSKKEVISYEK